LLGKVYAVRIYMSNPQQHSEDELTNIVGKKYVYIAQQPSGTEYVVIEELKNTVALMDVNYQVITWVTKNTLKTKLKASQEKTE
jgi:hypothetical protein